jgi:2'-5' RNA ligase
MSALRCFVAVPLPSPVADVLQDVGEVVRKTDPRWKAARWVDPRNLHITLRFIGAVEPDRVADLTEAISRAIAGHVLSDFALDAIQASPSPRRPRMLWATFLDEGGELESLTQAVDETVVGLGFEGDSRPFRPHATLCRLKSPIRFTDAAADAASTALAGSPVRVSDPKCTLFSSRLTPRGPVYSELSVWGLGER